jgi:hypothetical protein
MWSTFMPWTPAMATGIAGQGGGRADAAQVVVLLDAGLAEGHGEGEVNEFDQDHGTMVRRSSTSSRLSWSVRTTS